MNTKTVGLASGKHSHHYLLLLLGIDAKGLLLCGRTMQVIDDELFYLLRIFANDRTYLSQIQTLNSTVYYSAFQDHSKNTVKSGLGTVKVSSDQYDSQVADQKGTPDLKAGIFVQNHCHNISTTSGGTDIKYHSSSHCWENNCKTQLQEHVMCKWRTKGINSFTGTYIERQGKRGIDSPAHGADSKEEKSKYNKCCIDDPHKCTYIPLRK